LNITWNWLWEKHDEVKDMFSFFVKSKKSSKETSLTDGSKSDLYKSNRDRNERNKKEPRSYNFAQKLGLILGPLTFVLILFLFTPESLNPEARAVLASTSWIAIWWMTEAIPIPATSLLPIILFPLTNSLDVGATTSAYGSGTIFLFMGGFMIALTMEKWNLHRRIALSIISVVGTNSNLIILGFMVSTGFLSMWISNTATAMMMVPIGLAIIYQVAEALKDRPEIDTSTENFKFGKALMLGIAYSASLGGISTLIGTPPNTLLAGAINTTYGIELSFARWMLFGVPISWTFILIAWVYLVKFAYPSGFKELPGGKEVIGNEKKALGKASYEERIVFLVFVFAALAWITRSFLLQKFIPNLDDTMIAIIASLILFTIPSKNRPGDRLLDWNTALKLPWGILLLFGGGLAIAAGFVESGLSAWMGEQLIGLQGVHLLMVLIIVGTLVIFLTEVTSNTATASMIFPIMAALAVALDIHPYSVMIVAAVSASCAFMLPVATPPNAVVFGSGYLRIPDMAKSGFFLNVIGVFLVSIAVYFLLPIVWGIDLSVFPVELK